MSGLTIIKEFVVANKDKKFFILRTRSYASKMSHFMRLWDEAKKDFPGIYLDPKIVHYGGRYYKRTFGIEFELDALVPDGYEEKREVESTL